MATHDYVIDNQTAPNFRADLNNALQAIVTTNSNATPPSVTYANMLWYETDTNILWKRNEANSGWISLGTLDETNSKFEPNQTFASQAEAQAGTDNTKAMTALRTAEAIAALAPAPTTATVLGATAGAGLGAVGTYAFLRNASATRTITAGTNYAGSNLRYSAIRIAPDQITTRIASAGTPSGTWKAMGGGVGSADEDGATVFLRIS
jgi:hypothetical protein